MEREVTIKIESREPHGFTQSDGQVVIQWNSQGWKLEAPRNSKGEQRHYLPCVECGRVLAQSWNVVSFTCAECEQGFPTVDELSRELESVRDDFEPEPPQGEEESEWLDVRLQVVDGGFSVHSGDAQYDTDHRGYWGAHSIHGDETDAELRAVAEELLEEARDHFAQEESEKL